MDRPRRRDDLTGLLLRGSLDDDFQRLAATPPVSLLLCDLDHLKLINDSLGHPAGDAVLQSLSAALQARLEPDWRAYRFGGDESLSSSRCWPPPETWDPAQLDAAAAHLLREIQ